MTTYRIVTGNTVGKQELKRFLQQVYPPAKSRFIEQHGSWLYRGLHNQWAAVNDNQVVAYCAVIPTTASVDGQTLPALWWVDLVVAPAFRGQGIQTLFDTKMRTEADLKLGFPNELAAKIHHKHGWGVRHNGNVLLLPLWPSQVNAVRRAQGSWGMLLRTAALAATPLVRLLLKGKKGYHPQSARRLEQPDPDLLAQIFARSHNDTLISTVRDAAFFQWRYRAAPYRDKLWYYVAGPVAAPTHYLIARRVNNGPVVVIRILDWYGDFGQLSPFRDLLYLLIRDAIAIGAAQITVMSFLPELTRIACRAGFLLRTTTRFCWHSTDSEIFTAMDTTHYWTLGDSDNDASV